MVHESDITLPTAPQPTRVTLAYLQSVPSGTVPEGPLGYLHKVRSVTGRFVDAIATSPYAHAYYESLSTNVGYYRTWAQGRSFDLVVRPPSRRHDSEPYAAAVRTTCYGAADLSELFTKPSSVLGGAMPSVADLLQHMQFSAVCSEASIYKHVAIVDDVFGRGITVAAVLQLLRDNGLPTESLVTVCAPLWMRQT